MAISILTNALLGQLSILVLSSSRPTRIPKELHLPPGPKSKPIIGNVLDLPKDHEWLMLLKGANQYGELIYTNIVGMHIVLG
ncbi:hypothetical protein M422DRAFT_267167 [Sphaerobolus stellatus SS14]|uniref:Uncharacterized protein n=1 Tax=Sphaerobolus stellatus (strain SS14) TaxID=990650 RepID=A0A0C9U9K9_SPHS4|nr:hypothetical protein M422DRAFT_267167 [Sphaerobolus stellatus SS14]